MNSSNAKGLTLIGLVSLVLGAAIAQLATGFGFAIPAAPLSLSVSVLAIGFAVLIAAIPIARYRKLSQAQKAIRRPNPFYAVRVLLFSRAAQITSVAFLGWHLGLGIWLLAFTPSVALVTDCFLGALFCLGGLIAALLAEWNCRTPKVDDEKGAA